MRVAGGSLTICIIWWSPPLLIVCMSLYPRTHVAGAHFYNGKSAIQCRNIIGCSLVMLLYSRYLKSWPHRIQMSKWRAVCRLNYLPKCPEHVDIQFVVNMPIVGWRGEEHGRRAVEALQQIWRNNDIYFNGWTLTELLMTVDRASSRCL